MIVYCCQDLIFATKVRAVAEALGVASRPVRTAEALRNRLKRVDDGKLNEPVTGVLIDLETGELGLGLIELAKAIQSDVPVVAFGSHVATQLLQAAHDHGADFVMAKSQFTATLADIVRRLGG